VSEHDTGRTTGVWKTDLWGGVFLRALAKLSNGNHTQRFRLVATPRDKGVSPEAHQLT
jgi:hypothetical protein